MPSKLKEMIPWLSHCVDWFFTAYDPPSALTTVTALIPAILPSDHNDHLWSPAPSPTVDPGARDTAGVHTSTPVPAGIPKADQPKETTNAAAAPTKKVNPNLGPQLNDPATQRNPPSHSRPDATELTNETKESSSPQQAGDPQRSSDLKQENDQPSNLDKANDPSHSGGNSEDSGQEADSKQESSTIQVSAQDSNQNKDPVSTNDHQEKVDEAEPFGLFKEGQSRTVNNQVVQRLSQGISIAGTTLILGAPPITISGTPIKFGSSILVIGSSIISIVTLVPKQFSITIAGQAITAAPTALAMADATTTSTPGARGFTINGTIVSLNTAAQLVVGSETIPLENEKAGSKWQTAGLGGLTAGGFGPGGPFRVGLGTGLPSPKTQGDVSNQAAGNGTGARVQIFRVSAVSLKNAFSWDRLVVFGVTMAILVYMCWCR